MEYVGQVIKGTPTPASSNQFGNLQAVAEVDPPAIHLLHPSHDGERSSPMDRCESWIEPVYLTSTAGDFSNPDSFRSGTPVQVSTLRQQVIVDTSSGIFTVININTITTTTQFVSDGEETQLGEVRAVLSYQAEGHLNAPGMSPTGWFGGCAVENKH